MTEAHENPEYRSMEDYLAGKPKPKNLREYIVRMREYTAGVRAETEKLRAGNELLRQRNAELKKEIDILRARKKLGPFKHVVSSRSPEQ